MFNLQLFAEGDVQEIQKSTETAESVPETPKNETQDIDVETKINAAVKKAMAKAEAEYQKRLEAAQKEAKKLEKMSEDERQKAELENTRKELERQKAEFEKEKIKYEASKVLAQRNLPVEFTEYLVAEDNESTLERITTFEKKFKAAIEAGVTEKLKGKAPQAGGGKNIDDGKAGLSSLAELIKQKQARK